MANHLDRVFVQNFVNEFFKEDNIFRNFNYLTRLPSDPVNCQLKLKDDLILAGLPFFFETINRLMENSFDWSEYNEFEGKSFKKSDNHQIKFQLPFNIVLTAERIALNLLQRASSIATYTNKFVKIANTKNIKILDTRKTTPGLRALEKYAVTVGGGFNHRYSQTDIWMIKDNHKSFFDGLEKALNFFKDTKSFYTPVVVEIHNLKELREAIELKCEHVMLDNFTPEEIVEAVKIKTANITYEVSGGIKIENLNDFVIDGVDAISTGSITYEPRQVDISLKYQRA